MFIVPSKREERGREGRRTERGTSSPQTVGTPYDALPRGDDNSVVLHYSDL